MTLAYIALGSNLGVPETQLGEAFRQLSRLPHSQLLRSSHWYRTEAIGGPEGQPDYLNAASVIKTELTPQQLLRELQQIEQNAGRTRAVRWAPRTLDLDIIWFEGVVQDDPSLTLPHPRAHLRAFVLQPLLDLNAQFTLHGESLAYWLELANEQRIQQVDFSKPV